VVASVSPAHSRNLNAFDDTAPLRNDRSTSGYRNVYFARKSDYGHPVWVAKVKTGNTLRVLPGSRSPDARECARYVAAWYAEQFGPDWCRVLDRRKANTLSVRQSRRHGGRFVAAVWVMGQPEEVRVLTHKGRDRWARTAETATYATRAAAREGARRYLVLLFGLCAPFVCFRT
jgi:hypothetical protein